MDIDTLVEPALSGPIDFAAPVELRRLDSLPDATTPFVIELTQFSGPLDLLLSLIRDESADPVAVSDPCARTMSTLSWRFRPRRVFIASVSGRLP